MSDLDLVRAYQRASGAERTYYREQVVARHTGLVHFLAQRFTHKGEPFDDLLQVGMVGLLGALERFDADRGVEFATFARPSIVGELKRYFRDKTWSVRVPRGLQELSLVVSATESELTQELGRSPTVTEIALRIDVSEEDILEALEASRSHNASSIDEPLDDEGGTFLGDVLGEESPEFDKTESIVSLVPLLESLPKIEQRVLHMRFFKGMVQSDIAAEIGVSQMQVSRILARTLARLRASLG